MPAQASRKRRAQSDIRGTDAASPLQRRRTQVTTGRRGRNGESSTQGARRGNRRAPEEEDEEEEDVEMEDADEDHSNSHDEMHKDRLVKNLVRLALASEHTRQPIRRTDITTKVLGQSGRQFKEIFSLAQEELRNIFGMELIELPVRDKVKLTQRRAAQNSEKGPSSSNSYILTSTLPAEYKDSEIIESGGYEEQTYSGLVTFVTSLIYLNSRILPANKLTRYLRRLDADEYTPLDKTEKLLHTMQKHGYVVRVKDHTGDETSYDYHLGPRAKVEIGEEGVKELVKTVYGVQVPEDLDTRFKRNVGIELKTNFDDESEPDAGEQAKKGKRPQKRTRRRNGNDEEGDDRDYE